MGDRVKVKLVSTGKSAKGTRTGYYKTTDKSNKPKPGGAKAGKLQKVCFDPRAINEKTGKPGAHVLFKEDKIKS
jgi:hypothetical protein